jgi:hypothetical protein
MSAFASLKANKPVHLFGSVSFSADGSTEWPENSFLKHEKWFWFWAAHACGRTCVLPRRRNDRPMTEICTGAPQQHSHHIAFRAAMIDTRASNESNVCSVCQGARMTAVVAVGTRIDPQIMSFFNSSRLTSGDFENPCFALLGSHECCYDMELRPNTKMRC